MLENNFTDKLEMSEFSVSEISNKIKSLLENNIGYVKIKGEISGLKIASSGHCYFTLKDANAVLAATCWRHYLANVNFKLEEGLEVVVTGKITAYSGQSKYQISAERIEPSGIGAFMKILKERKLKLQQEGLFAKEHKQKLPFLPLKIGIVTSITGAVIKDIIHRISDRFPINLIVWPVTVQGEEAAGEITTAINNFNQLDAKQKPDLLIIARGGGSIEDLWPFNEEIVIRAAYNSKIPIISAVGHETDYTLLDLVADVRAPTPTAAAEFAVPVITDIKYTLNSLFNIIESRVTKLVKYNYQIISSYNRILQYPTNYLNTNMQKIDELGFRLSAALPNLFKQKNQSLSYFPLSRMIPHKLISYKNLQVNNSFYGLLNKKTVTLQKFNHKLELNCSILSSLDYNKVLKRGYTMIKNEQGNYLSNAADANKQQKLQIKFHDGEITVSSLYKE
ncbi:MAG: exodeoxyribonuclease VII large subunit [Rickettsiaceae bacterium]|nr:exodeoxyribonuclease VII large subunit [Rickettsiaceae bacterium]